METALEFPITVTAAAIAHAKRLLKKDGREGAFLRVGVKGGGCSGFEYLIRTDVTSLPIDMVSEMDGVRIVCDAKSARFLQGTQIDYTGNLLGTGFKFDNPNVVRSCGCGTSFTPKPSG